MHNKENVKKITSFLNRIADSYILLICLIVLLLGTYHITDAVYVFFHASNSYRGYKPEVADLSDENIHLANSVAWLTIDGTPIDYPIMQGSDNFYYLNVDPLGNYSLSGSIFLDYRNDGFNDDYSVVYGHHMEHGLMFGALDIYSNIEYFYTHRTGKIIIEGKEHDLNVFASGTINADDVLFTVPLQRDTALEYIRSVVNIFAEPKGGRIVALTTCTSDPSSSERFVVFTEIRN